MTIRMTYDCSWTQPLHLQVFCIYGHGPYSWHPPFATESSIARSDCAVHFRWILVHWMDRNPNRWDANVGTHCPTVWEWCTDYLCTCTGSKVVRIFQRFYYNKGKGKHIPSKICVRLLLVRKFWNTFVPDFMPAKNVINGLGRRSLRGWSISSFVAFFISSRCGSLYLQMTESIVTNPFDSPYDVGKNRTC